MNRACDSMSGEMDSLLLSWRSNTSMGGFSSGDSVGLSPSRSGGSNTGVLSPAAVSRVSIARFSCSDWLFWLSSSAFSDSSMSWLSIEKLFYCLCILHYKLWWWHQMWFFHVPFSFLFTNPSPYTLQKHDSHFQNSIYNTVLIFKDKLKSNADNIFHKQ